MKVALLTGPSPAGRCGITDYTNCLASALRMIGVESDVITTDLVGGLAVPRLLRELRSGNFDVLHIQYPTVGFGTGLGPQVLALLKSCVITIHEASRCHILRKLALLPFTVRAQHIVVTSEFERRFLMSRIPWISQVSSVIPIGSNISKFSTEGPRTVDEIVHFGLIMPRKGLEEVLKLGELIKSTGLPLRIRIIGKPPVKHLAYFESLRSRSAILPIIWDDDLEEAQIAQRLARSSIAYLPYPDGASERRATLKAALLNGVAVITTRGSHTPGDFDGLVRFCKDPEEALGVVRSLLESPPEIATLSRKAVEYGQRYTWERIAYLHALTYQNILSPRSRYEIAHIDCARPENHLSSKSGK